MEDVMNLFQNLKAWTGGKENEIDTTGLDIFQSGLVYTIFQDVGFEYHLCKFFFFQNMFFY